MKTINKKIKAWNESVPAPVKDTDCEIFGLEKITADTHMILILKDKRQADMFNRAIARVHFVAVAFTLNVGNYNSARNKMLACLKSINLDFEMKPLALMVYDTGDGDTPLEKKFLAEFEKAGYQSSYDWYRNSFDELLFEGGKDNLILEMHRLYQKHFKEKPVR